MNNMKGTVLVGMLLGVVALSGCRGTFTDKPPVHIVQNMDSQEKFEPQEANPFFADTRAMRAPVTGTVARGFLKEDARFYRGRKADGSFVTGNPVALTMDFMRRGQDRYEIFCAVCHGLVGDGRGIIMTGNYGFVPAPTYHSELVRDQPDGYFYDVIVNGIRTMSGYAQQIPVADRWAIVAYVRALQRSQFATDADLPDSQQ